MAALAKRVLLVALAKRVKVRVAPSPVVERRDVTREMTGVSEERALREGTNHRGQAEGENDITRVKGAGV